MESEAAATLLHFMLRLHVLLNVSQLKRKEARKPHCQTIMTISHCSLLRVEINQFVSGLSPLRKCFQHYIVAIQI